jgi:hypothetical protein
MKFSSGGHLSILENIFTLSFFGRPTGLLEQDISSGASLILSMVSFDVLASSSKRKIILEVNTSRSYQKHQHKRLD